MTIPLAGYAANGEVRSPHGSGVAEIVPYQAFQTMDGWMMIAAGNDNLFRRLCDVLGLEDAARDERFRTNEARVNNRDAIVGLVAEKVAKWRDEKLSAALDAAGVPNAPLYTVDQVFDHPQVRALDVIRPAEGDSLPLMGTPLAFDGRRPRSKGTAPQLGEDNERVLRSTRSVKLAG